MIILLLLLGAFCSMGAAVFVWAALINWGKCGEWLAAFIGIFCVYVPLAVALAFVLGSQGEPRWMM